jgi:fumarate reductase subunit C
MAHWWRRDAFFMRYMAREATAPFVALYALVLLAGLVQLARGREAYESFLAALGSPASIALHGILAAAFVYHTITWFQIMPKTLPPILWAGKRVTAAMITGGGIAVAALASLALWAALWWAVR